jgi:hypothetical protein
MTPSDAPAYPSHPNYCSVGLDIPLFQPFTAPTQQTYGMPHHHLIHPIKRELYADDEVNPFSMSYASMANEITTFPTLPPYVSRPPASYPPRIHHSFPTYSG